MKYALIVASLFVCLFAFAQDSESLANSQMPSVVTVPPAAQPSAHFDPEAATEAYLAQIPPAAKARSDAYFEGGYWLILWDFLYGAVVALLLLQPPLVGAHARLRGARPRDSSRCRPLIYWIEYLVLTTILGFPLAWYEGYFREHKYGLATQTFGPWMRRSAQGLARRRRSSAASSSSCCSASCESCRAPGGSGARS